MLEEVGVRLTSLGGAEEQVRGRIRGAVLEHFECAVGKELGRAQLGADGVESCSGHEACRCCSGGLDGRRETDEAVVGGLEGSRVGRVGQVVYLAAGDGTVGREDLCGIVQFGI